MKWYVMQPFYRRWRELDSALDKAGIPYMHPYHFQLVTNSPDGSVTDTANHHYDIYSLDVRPVPILQMIFVYADEVDLPNIRTAAYEHGKLLCDRTVSHWKPLTVPGDQLLRFFRALSLNARYDIIDDRPDVFAKGDHVRVVDGDRYVGLEGVICRIKHNKHLIVRIEGVCAIATDYIPQAFVVKKGTPSYDRTAITTPYFELAELAFYLRTLIGLCRERSVGRAQIETTVHVLTEARRLIMHSVPLARRIDLSPEQVDVAIARLTRMLPTADAGDNSMPLECHKALQLCNKLKAHYTIFP